MPHGPAEHCLFQGPYFRNGPSIQHLTLGNMQPDFFRPLRWLACRILPEVLLDGNPVSLTAARIEQDQDNRQFLEHPQILSAYIQIVKGIGTDQRQRFGRLELKPDEARLRIALSVKSEQHQVTATVLFHSLRTMALINDEPFHV